ncbi:hypothetical protein B9G69_014045 [Bdellovibrio sp. SKB1291214]|uniref:hypothetical protein n=1 Tax=Bdellovibrio sp. SKB1291214 TaxID=1732569 RepID=UPI000B768E7F|nr:hypothetical protein [Bdellovibrio sp. SKB1291214]UYL08169.1 hypothetical protein B9G69_014045 [Bdellovibrio sp. SKB1291214]
MAMHTPILDRLNTAQIRIKNLTYLLVLLIVLKRIILKPAIPIDLTIKNLGYLMRILNTSTGSN